MEGIIIKGSAAGANVLIENQIAAVVGDKPYGCFGCACLGCPEINRIVTGSTRVLVGNMPIAHEESACTPYCVKGQSLAKTVYVGI